ncbi:SusC/RagA family TonB-linked outer membrane protein [Sediminicola luteus]|uniref:SusC/RagA family TonB-linked outer membrane protein n=1 Tax=Sediminicola luteus TaxID=319238 RepID=A0A2A4G7Y5_9FLAO|nr:SusC/RagA family TonB-linked outer membrane protein [Sediminicola luteus]PCE64541.1 SusC/RagA family TonB-linked outer membrane protein [Sediminicola luteus]
MKTKLKGVLTLLVAFVVHITFAQQKTVSGTVIDEYGLPLPGVNIVIEGTTQGTQTDFDGNYSISASTGQTLLFTYIGQKDKRVTVGSSNRMDVTMETDTETLEEVVVVGYGQTTKKAFAGTATVVKAEVLEAKNFSNVTQALTGEVAGVTVINTSGQPGTVATVRVRGYGSPNGNRAPLYVVDGIPFAGTFDLNSVNPADIESTTVLKDATATAIYGSRGANGVILINTKRGRSEMPFVEVDVKTGINRQLIPRYEVLDNPEEYVGYVWEGLYNRGVVTGNADPVDFANNTLLGDNGIGNGYNMWNVNTGGELIDPETRTVRPGVQRLFTPERYADEAFGTGFRNEVNLRAGGSTDKSNYYTSIGYLNDEGYSINSDYKRYTARINLSSQIKPWLKIGSNLNFVHSESTNNGQIIGSENLFEFADKMAPIYPVFARHPETGQLLPDNVYGGYQYDYGSPTGTQNGFERSRPNANLLNPIGSAVYDYDGRKTNGINGNLKADFKFTDYLKAEISYGGQWSLQRRQDMTNNVWGSGANTNGSLSVEDRIRYSTTFLQLLRFNKSFGDHNLEVLAAHETFERGFSYSDQYKEDVIVPGLYNLSNYSLFPSAPSGYEDNSGIESYFGQVNYNFNGKYFLTGSLRTDGSSRFVNKKWGTFGSIGASWVISEENFMKDTFFNYLKAKASYGVTGDQDGVDTYSGFTIFNANYVGGLALSENRPGDPNLTWETSRQFQAGLEMTIGNFLDINLDYYKKDTDNTFFDRRVGPSAGFSSIRVNDGEVRNEGFEFDINARIVNTEDFKLNFAINGEMLNNEMLVMPLDPSTGIPKVIDENSSTDGNYAFSVGRSTFDFYMRDWAGVDAADGAPMWYQYYDDRNNNGQMDSGEGDFSTFPNGDESTTSSLYEYEQAVGDANIQRTVTKTYADATQVYLDKSFIPDLRGAFRIGGAFKNFDFSTQFTYSLGGYAYDAQYAELMSDRFGAAGNNFHKDIRNRWQKPGDITNVPLLSDNAVVNGTSTSSRFITSTDYLALNNARIGYTFDGKSLEGTGLHNLNFWVSGDNIFIQTARKGFNPSVREVGSSARRIYAPASTFTLGVRAKF